MPDLRPLRFGPEPPRSKWRLDHLPQPVLDSIVDALADLALDLASPRSWKSSYFTFICEEKPPFVPLSAELKAMSMTNKTFRQNVFGRKIVPYIEVKTPKQYTDVHRILSRETRRYVR
jgi:hypothetical protein